MVRAGLQGLEVTYVGSVVISMQAPELITSEMVAGMKAGSVTVDLAAANGGNVGTTEKDKVVVTENG